MDRDMVCGISKRDRPDLLRPLAAAGGLHKRPFEGYPDPVLGAVTPFLKLLCGHSLPKVDNLTFD
jgi:hypothetical protein